MCYTKVKINKQANMTKNFMLRFKGKKAELHAQLKAYCALNCVDINVKVIDLIQKHLELNKMIQEDKLLK